MEKRLRGVAHRALLPRLPRNLLVFDGHCLQSQARVRHVLERNFNYFSMIPYFLGDEGDMAEQLDRHRIHLLSFDTSEAEELERLLLGKAASAKAMSGSHQRTADSGAGPQERQELVFLFVEKVPSRSASFLVQKRACATSAFPSSLSTSGGRTDELFDNPTTIDDSYASFSGKNVVKKKNPVNVSEGTMSTQALKNPEDVDLMVSTNFAALCRVGMHLDRWLLRNGWRLVYWCLPRSVGDWWFERSVIQRRRTMWGTSEKDAVATLGIIEGMKERRWSWRTRYPH